MTKLDVLLQELLRSGRITIAEAMGIGASVRAVAFNLSQSETRQYYGDISIEAVKEMLQQ
jgi:hypothetical protein